MARKKIELSDSLMDVVTKMAEGNPGAANVIGMILQNDQTKGLFTLLDLDDMNIRGPQIWVGFKDHCHQDLDKFVKAANDRDEAMIETINRECYHPNLVNQSPTYGERAVPNRASFRT